MTTTSQLTAAERYAQTQAVSLQASYQPVVTLIREAWIAGNEAELEATPPLRLLFERIRLAWLKFPEQRLGQLICNALLPDSGSQSAPLFYADDAALVAAVEAYCAQPAAPAVPREGEREILVGSTWRRNSVPLTGAGDAARTVRKYDPSGKNPDSAVETCRTSWREPSFRAAHTWLSDPQPAQPSRTNCVGMGDERSAKGTLSQVEATATKLRVVIESPFGRNVDGSKCTPAEYARNARYLDRCIRDSLSRGEAPYASHGFFPAPGRLDDTIPEQRKQGIDAGLAWGAAGQHCAVYVDHGETDGMTQGIAQHTENGLTVERRRIGEEPDLTNPEAPAEATDEPSPGSRVLEYPEQGEALGDEIAAAHEHALLEAKDRIAELEALINMPRTDDFFEAVRHESAHQVERFGTAYDAGKQPQDWFWLLGYLSGKALSSAIRGDTEKALHHVISSAAALLNWHRELSGNATAMRPGIAEPEAPAETKGELYVPKVGDEVRHKPTGHLCRVKYIGQHLAACDVTPKLPDGRAYCAISELEPARKKVHADVIRAAEGVTLPIGHYKIAEIAPWDNEPTLKMGDALHVSCEWWPINAVGNGFAWCRANTLFTAVRRVESVAAPVAGHPPVSEQPRRGVWEFAEAILHGDSEHRRWLRNAATEFIGGHDVSAPPSAPVSEPVQHARSEATVEHARLPRYVPWEFVRSHDSQARRNHGQTLARLAERGGLDVTEALAVVKDRPWEKLEWRAAIDEFMAIFASWKSLARASEPKAPPVVEPMSLATEQMASIQDQRELQARARGAFDSAVCFQQYAEWIRCGTIIRRIRGTPAKSLHAEWNNGTMLLSGDALDEPEAMTDIAHEMALLAGAGASAKAEQAPCAKTFRVHDELLACCSLGAGHNGDHRDSAIDTWWADSGFETTIAHAGTQSPESRAREQAPMQPSNAERDIVVALLDVISRGIEGSDFNGPVSHARKALSELKKRIGGERG